MFTTNRLCGNAKTSRSVIPNEVRDLVFSAAYEYEIPRLRLGMTVATQSGRHEELEGRKERTSRALFLRIRVRHSEMDEREIEPREFIF